MNEPLRITTENITRIKSRLASLDRQRYSHFSELAHEIGNKIEADELESVYREIKDELLSHSDAQSSDEAVRRFSLVSRENDSLLEGALLCELISKKIEFSHPYSEISDESARIEYVRSYYADNAYRKFAKKLTFPTVSYGDSASAVCENLFFGRCDYCILPIESSGEGILTAFGLLIAKYELFPAFVYDAEVENGGFIRFALLSASPRTSGKPNFARITVYPDEKDVTTKLLTAAGYYGATLLSCITLPCNNETTHVLTFDISKADTNALTAYLNLELPESTAIAMYGKLL